MSLRPHSLRTAFFACLAVGILLAAVSPTTAGAPRGLFAPGARATSDVAYRVMRETTSLRPDGSGEERIEFVISNSGSSAVSATNFYFRVGSTQYWGIEAFDDQGSIGHSIVASGNELHVTIHFRQSLAPGAQYRYTFVINFPDLAEESGGEWAFDWGTSFPVEEFVRTVYLPGGSARTHVSPAPDEQTADYIRWRRYNITLFELSLRYTLRALTAQELAEEFAPSFRLHSSEAYAPMPVALALQHAECYAANGQKRACSTGLLGGDWLNATGSYVDFQGYPGDDLDEANSSHTYYQNRIRHDPANTPVVYARVWPDGGRTVLQYWLYYYYNAWGHQGGLGAGLHEGDWEMVQVVLDSEQNPLYAVFAQHLALPAPYLNFNGASKKEWNDLARDTVEGDHPIVYPGLGSHASYFGPYPYLFNLDQTASEATTLLRPAVYLLQPDGADPWVGYDGKWGQPRPLLPPYFQGGPPSPADQGQKWDSPLVWGETRVPWDEFAGHNRGKVRAHVDVPCKVGLLHLNTGQRFGWVFNEYERGIPGGEYIINETGGTEAAILHDSFKIDASFYRVFTTCPAGGARQAETRQLTVEFYDATIDELVTARYVLPSDWLPAQTIAELALGDPGLALAVDRDGDDVTDELVPPVEIITEPVEPQATSSVAYIPSILR